MSYKFTLGLLIGATLGATIVHYLNTQEGKALVDRVSDDATELTDNISGLADDLIQKGKSVFQKAQPEEGIDTVVVVV